MRCSLSCADARHVKRDAMKILSLPALPASCRCPRARELNRYPTGRHAPEGATAHRACHPGVRGAPVGNGSDDIIQMLVMATARPGAP